MNADAALKFAKKFERTTAFDLRPGATHYIGVKGVKVFVTEEKFPRIVIQCENASHSLALSVSTRERIEAHFKGFLANRGLLAPVVGKFISFPSGSSSDGWRDGRVVEVTDSRVLVSFKFKHGGKSQKWCKLSDVRW